MNRQDELDAMYTILRRGCAGTICTDCPGAKYDHCGDYNKAVNLYEAGWHKPTEAEWKSNSEQFSNIYNHFYCSHCNNYTNERNPYKLGKYCSFCGAKMIGRR